MVPHYTPLNFHMHTHIHTHTHIHMHTRTHVHDKPLPSFFLTCHALAPPHTTPPSKQPTRQQATHLSLQGAGTVADGEAVDPRVLRLHAHKGQISLVGHLCGIVRGQEFTVMVPGNGGSGHARDVGLEGDPLSLHGSDVLGLTQDGWLGSYNDKQQGKERTVDMKLTVPQ